MNDHNKKSVLNEIIYTNNFRLLNIVSNKTILYIIH